MIRVLTALKSVLELETVEYRQMLALAAEKRDVLLKNDVAGLEFIVARETVVLKRIKQLETEREALIARTAALSHRPKDALRLTDIIAMAGGELRGELVRLRGELGELTERMKNSNTMNRGLIETQLQYANFCVNLLSGQEGTLSVYSNAGEMNDKEDLTYLIDQSI